MAEDKANEAYLACARRLGRPLVFFDLETTGTSVQQDRIVEIAATRATPRGELTHKQTLVNPEMPIPKAATDVHGITDAQVVDAPRFRQLAKSVYAFFEGATVVGYNALRFDVPLLVAEFARAGIACDEESFSVVDPFVIFQKREPRDLAGALRFYCDDVHDGAHRSKADIDATARVLEAQLGRYDDLPTDALALALDCLPTDSVDRGGWFVWREDKVVFARGKHSGVAVERAEQSYLRWMLGLADLPGSTRRLVEQYLEEGVLPLREGGVAVAPGAQGRML